MLLTQLTLRWMLPSQTLSLASNGRVAKRKSAFIDRGGRLFLFWRFARSMTVAEIILSRKLLKTSRFLGWE